MRQLLYFSHFKTVAASCVISLGLSVAVNGATVFDLEFLAGANSGTNQIGTETLNLATPGQLLTGGTALQYNTIDDANGTKLVSPNGDASDFTLSGSSTSGALGSARVVIGAMGGSSPFGSVASGRISEQHGFNGAVSGNNPGTVSSNTFTLLFNDHLTVTDASFNFSSLNTPGTTWEYSVIQLLDSNRNPFNALTNPGWTVGAASQYDTAKNTDEKGFTGQAGIGNYIAASTSTVSGVGNTATTNGSTGPSNSISAFDYDTVSLPEDTQIGGITWTTYLEDVRGTGNGDSNLSSSLLDFTIRGTITAVPEPSPMLLLAFVCLGSGASKYVGKRSWHRRHDAG